MGSSDPLSPLSPHADDDTWQGGSETDTTRLIARQETLLAFVESISSELELRPLLTGILRAACELIGADHGTIGLVDDERSVVRTEATYNMPEDELGAEMRPGVGLAGQVLVTGEPVVLARYGDVEAPARLDSLENSVIGMPIAWRGRMIGFFGIGVHADRAPDASPVHRFSPKDLDSLSVFARHAAIAITNARRYQREQQRTERLRLISRIARIITGSISVTALLQAAADAIHELLGYPNVAIPLVEGDELVLTTVGGHYRHIIKGEYRIPMAQGIMGAAATSGQVVLVNDVSADPRHIATPGAAGIRAELAVPIRLAGRVLGVLNVESPDTFGEEDAASLEIVADQLAVGIEHARLYESGQRLAVLEERQRLARDLHDSVTQQIFAMNLIAESLATAWDRDPAEGRRRSHRLFDLSRAALAEMRALVAELRPDDMHDTEAPDLSGITRLRKRGLVDAIRHHLEQFATAQIATDMEVLGWTRQPPDLEEALFRIAQEAINNAVKHAAPNRIEVTLGIDVSVARMSVRDDGRGFDQHSIERDGEAWAGGNGGFGLTTMRERAQGVGGVLVLRSSPGAGTLVETAVPVTGETAP